ncbi:MAG TPA: response regulator [Steroidobacteraceae bacterium]|nr:response regulator [Steroidobacteraceae bacterium]
MNAIPGVILHVDDDPSVRESLSLLLQSDGYLVASAASGTEALQLAGEGFRPDVLIVDFDLGKQLNGVETAEQIHRLLGYSLPIMILSGDLSRARNPRITEGVVWRAAKPLCPRTLLTALPSLVHLSRVTRALPTRA